MRHLVSPFPPVGSVAAPFGSPAVPHLRWYYGVVRLLVHPSSVASGFPWRPSYHSCERRWWALLGSWEILGNMPWARDSGDPGPPFAISVVPGCCLPLS